MNHANWPAELSFDQIGYVFHLKHIPGAFGVSARALTMQPMVETTAYQPDPTIGTGRTFGFRPVGMSKPIPQICQSCNGTGWIDDPTYDR